MARKAPTLLIIAPSADDLLAQDRHTDWATAQEGGRHRNGRAYLGHRVHGSSKTKKGRSRDACRGQLAY